MEGYPVKIQSVLLGSFTNCYFLIDEQTNHMAIVDPGFEAQKVIRMAKGFEVDYVLLTHAHFDHISAAGEVLAATGAKLAAHKAALEELIHPSASVSGLFGSRAPDPLTPDVLLEDGDTLSVGSLTVKALYTPGHSRGDCCYVCSDVIFSGDILFQGDVGRTDLPGGSYPTLLQSLQKLKKLPGDYRVFPGHGPETTLEAERRHNSYMNQVDYDSFD